MTSIASVAHTTIGNQTMLVCLDLIQAYLAPTGTQARAGYLAQATEQDTLQRIDRIQSQIRSQGGLIVHVRTQFTEHYPELAPHNSGYKHLPRTHSLLRNTPDTAFMELTQPQEGDPILTKHRLSAFHDTRLATILRSRPITNLFLCGVGLEGNIGATARAACDYDYHVHVLADACLAPDAETHDFALQSLKRFCHVGEWSSQTIKLTA